MSIKTFYEEQQIEMLNEIVEKLHKTKRRIDEIELDIEDVKEEINKKLRKM